MPVIGLLLGAALASRIGDSGRYIGAGLLVLTGAWTIYQGRKTGEEEREEEAGRIRTRRLLLLGAALSIDNLVVGFALGVFHISIVLAAVMIAVVSVSLSLLGLDLGSRLGATVGERSEEIGGVVLILVGFAIGAGLI